MIRALAALSAACAVAACGAGANPSRADVRGAVRDYYRIGPAMEAPELRDARVSGVGECRSINEAHHCLVAMQSAALGEVPVSAWLQRDGRTWRVQHIAVSYCWP
jgi:hypothetical protein